MKTATIMVVRTVTTAAIPGCSASDKMKVYHSHITTTIFNYFFSFSKQWNIYRTKAILCILIQDKLTYIHV